MEIFRTRDFDGAEFLEMRGEPLGVEESEAARAQMFHQREQRNLGGVPHMVKHRFAEKGGADRDAVKAARERAILPGFDGMRVAQSMQPTVTFHNLIVDPGFGTLRALLHHFGKRDINSNFETLLSHRALEGVRDMKFIERKNRAGIGGKPFDLAVIHRHGKHAEAVPLEQNFGSNHGSSNVEVRSPNVKSIRHSAFPAFVIRHSSFVILHVPNFLQ